jgi:hypothetical protein
VNQAQGYTMFQNYLAQLLGLGNLSNSMYQAVGSIPNSALGSEFGSSGMTQTLQARQLEEQIRQARANEGLGGRQLEEEIRQASMADKLQRDLEAGRITQQDKDRAIQQMQVESQSRYNEGRLGIDREQLGISREELALQKLLGTGRLDLDRELGRGGLDIDRKRLGLDTQRLGLDTELGRRGMAVNEYGARLQGAQTEADLAANPRDFIKLAFFRQNKPVPPELQRYTGTVQAPQRLEKGGNISHGPTISTVGEKDLEYALLAPGSVIAPRSPGEEPNMNNAIKAIMSQLMKTGIDPSGHDGLKQAAGGMSVTDPLAGYNDQALASIGIRRLGGKYYKGFTMLQPSQLPTLASQLQASGVPSATVTGTYGNTTNTPQNPVGGSTGTPQPPQQPVLPPEFAHIPFIQSLREHSAPNNYPGIANPFGTGSTNAPINPYNPHVGFEMQKAAPTDQAMALAYNSGFGIPDDDFMHTAQQTMQGYGLVQPGMRAAFRPMFN